MEKEKAQPSLQKAAIQLREFHVVGVKFYPFQEEENLEKAKLNLKSKPGFDHQNLPDAFHLTLQSDLYFPDTNFKLEVELMGVFACQDMEVNELFMNSTFVQVNAPAILYPYLRAFISSFMATAGYQAPIIPAINFAQFLNQPKKDQV